MSLKLLLLVLSKQTLFVKQQEREYYIFGLQRYHCLTVRVG